MAGENDNLQNPRPRTLPHASLRLIIVSIFELCMAFHFTHNGAVSANDYDFDTGLNEFLFAFVPTVLILFLIPVIVRGSSRQKAIAIFLSLLPAWMAFYGWQTILQRQADSHAFILQ